ncbi:MAG: PH domain-containing protein [Gammaproteobacteria bacterium]|nr:PH domain-containing protein [Pseudomaricurvus alcaniphilus]MBR9912103.1 PH domain-containing protein [Gammaproteobacteria bacterium]NHN35755.1 PH domain-containing protein [Pseudomaricurvus alcaniphilus]
MFKNKPFSFILSIVLIPVLVGMVILLVWYLKCKSTKLELIGDDLILEKGLLSKDRTELDVDSIRTFNVYQSFANRLFGVGTVSVFTAGDDPEIEVAGLPRPDELRDLVKAVQKD